MFARTYDDWLDGLATEPPFAARSDAELTLRETIARLSAWLAPELRNRIAGELPRELAEALLEPAPGESTKSVLLEAVRPWAGGNTGRALEQVEVVCDALATNLSPETRAHLELALPEELRLLLTQRAPLPAPSPHRDRTPHVEPGTGHTLSTGRPGSRHPVADATQVGHRESIARSDDPHAEEKLSSSRGLSSERAGRTLSTGVQGSTHPLAESED